MGWIYLGGILLLSVCAASMPLPQGGVGGAGAHGQPQAGSPSTPGPGAGGIPVSGSTGSAGPMGAGASGTGAEVASVSSGVKQAGVTGASTSGGGTGGGGAATGRSGWSTGPARRGRGWRDWRRGDPTLIKGLWKSKKGPLESLGQAEVYIFLALLIGGMTVVVGCWLSDNCWSPEPEEVVTLA